jgi:predicted  nucleic acid-binding Zn-ribbon protein
MTDLHKEDALQEAMQLIARLRNHIELLQNEHNALIQVLRDIRNTSTLGRAKEVRDAEA